MSGDEQDRLAEIEARAAAATDGPWRWCGNVDYAGRVELMSFISGRPVVMGFKRAGMQGAEPYFFDRDPDDEHRGWGGKFRAARDIAVREVDYRGDIVALDNADAEFIAQSRADIDWLLAEVNRLRDEKAELGRIAKNIDGECSLVKNCGAAALCRCIEEGVGRDSGW